MLRSVRTVRVLFPTWFSYSQMKFFLFFFFLAFFAVVHGQQGRGLTYSDYDICAVKGSTVTISSTYRLPSEDTLEQFFWFIKSEDDQYQKLSNVPRFSGRVSYGCSGQTCTLTMRNLTRSDSAELCFGFTTTTNPLLYLGEPGVTLIVTGGMFTALSFKSSTLWHLKWKKKWKIDAWFQILRSAWGGSTVQTTFGGCHVTSGVLWLVGSLTPGSRMD